MAAPLQGSFKDQGPRYIIFVIFFVQKKTTRFKLTRWNTSTNSICFKFDFLEKYGQMDIEKMQKFSKTPI